MDMILGSTYPVDRFQLLMLAKQIIEDKSWSYTLDDETYSYANSLDDLEEVYTRLYNLLNPKEDEDNTKG